MRCQSSNPHQVCWKCGATKGTHDVEMAYTNCADDAPRRDTIYTTLPWDEEPSLSKPPGFNLKMLGLDILHIFILVQGEIWLQVQSVFWHGYGFGVGTT